MAMERKKPQTKAPATKKKGPDKEPEPKKAEATKDEPKKTEPKKTEPKKTEPKKTEPKKTEPKKQEPKQPAARKPAEKAAAKEVDLAPVVVRASAKYVRVAPRKARLIADQVRGLHIDDARALLEFSPRGAARDIQKLVESAASNAENNYDLVSDEMRIAAITVDEGPTLRRYRPRALGRATTINKRTSHISLALTPEEG